MKSPCLSDANKDGSITIKEWGKCLGLKEGKSNSTMGQLMGESVHILTNIFKGEIQERC
jgi:hypothetical protein